MNIKEKKNLKFRNQLESLNSDDSQYKSESIQKDYPAIKTTNNVTSLFDTRTSKKETKPNSVHAKRIKTSKSQSKNKKTKKNDKFFLKDDKIELYKINKKSKNNKNMKDIISQATEKGNINSTNNILNYNSITDNREIDKTSDSKNYTINNTLNNISVYSTQCLNDEKIPRLHRQYYFLDNKEVEKRRIDLLRTSYNFNKFNNQRGIIRMINRFKNKEELEAAKIEYRKKYDQFTYKKRIPTKVAFGKGTTNELIEINNNYNFNKKRKQQRIKKIKISEKINDLFKNGFNIQTEKKLFINKSHRSNENKKQIFITNSNWNSSSPKDSFGNQIYPVFAKHKILKNILPKEVDYNTKTTINDIINNEIHPLLRYQKKIMTQSSNLISQELNVLFAKYISLSKIKSDKEVITKRKDILIELSRDEKFIELMKTLIGKDKEKEKELQDKMNEEEKKKKLMRRKYLLNRFKKVILLACDKMKKYNIDIHIFYSLMKVNKDDENYQKEFVKKGQYLFRVIKARDIDEMINVINQNNFLVAYKDEFNQIPLHICAKRNIYEVIAFLLSRLSPIDAQDESGRTALMIAAQNNYLEFVTILLFENANPKIKDINKHMASDLTTDEKIRFILKRAEALHNLKLFIEGKNLQKIIVNGLDYLYKKELEIHYEKWINKGLKIVKDAASFI
jgi:ankyrin repeat protein